MTTCYAAMRLRGPDSFTASSGFLGNFPLRFEAGIEGILLVYSSREQCERENPGAEILMLTIRKPE